jgi:hypothetical protein
VASRISSSAHPRVSAGRGGFADPQILFHEWSMEHSKTARGTELAARYRRGHSISTRVGRMRCVSAFAMRNVIGTSSWSNLQLGFRHMPLWGLQTDVPLFLNQGRG